MNSVARVALPVNRPSVRLIFDSAEMGCDLPHPFAAGLLADGEASTARRFNLPVPPRRFEPSEADRAWWAAESARLDECRELAEMHAESVAIDRLERGCCL